MRAVLDLNVYVSALINPTGTPAQVVRLGLERRYEIVVCPALLTELAEVLDRWGVPAVRHARGGGRARRRCRWRVRRGRRSIDG